jgi:hypothetical protein
MSTLSKLAQYNNNRGVAPTSVGVASKKESTSTLGKLQNYAQQAAEEQARAAQAAAEGEKNNGGFFGGLGYLGEKIGLGFLSGIEGIWDYTAGGLAKLFGADDWAERQFANDWVNYSHADEWYNPSDGWKVAGDVAGGIGTSLPAIAGVAAAAAIAYFSGGSLSGVSAGIISGVVAGLGAAGNATKEAYRETGELGGKEFGYGALSGITEGAVEGLSAGIGAGTGAIVKNISKSFGKEVAKTTAKAAARETFGKAIIKGFVGEAFEEGLSEFLDPYWKRLTYDPEAKNATAQEIGYAALIGGLSGAIMGGFDATVRNTSNTIRGNNIVNKGTATDVITTAENIANSDIYTDQYESFGAVKNILNELQTSMQKTDGEIRTVKQKMLLGYLERANTYTVFEPMVQKNAARIVANADAIAERLNTYGYTDAQGKPITYTAEQIRAGINTNNPKSYAKALKTNNILRTLAVVDATGQLYMDTKKFEAATLRGETLSSQVDLNRFIETASQEELHSVAEKLDIADWQGLTNEQFKEKIVAFAERGGIEEYQTEQHTNADIKAAADAVDVQKAKAKIPQKFTAKKDGVTRYTQGGVDMAVIKNGDSYRIYDYESGKLSKPLTLQQVNERLSEIRGKVDSVINTAAVESITTEESRQAAEIDAYAAENISAYSKLSDANKSLVRGVIRQARAAGISEADSLSYARVAAHAGINISFDKQAKVGDIEILKVGTDESGNAIYADGVYFPETNSIYVNPEAKRSQERLLIHELTHAIFTTSDGKVFLMDGVEKMSAAEKETIIKRYVEAGHGGTVEIIDEINAHFAEGQLQNKKLLKRLTEEKPSFKQKILSFFKKSSSEYNSDERLSGAAKKLYKQYKKMFDSFAAENQHNNAFEPVKISEAADSSRMALSDALKTLGEYSETRKRHIESREYDTISRDYNEISEFIKSANKLAPVKRLHIGTISDTTAELVFKKTGVDIKNYDFVLASNYIAHIFDGHGDVNVETPRGQKAVTFANIENVLETVITPDDVSLVSDNNGTALRFEKRLDGRNIAITVTSTKKSTLTLKSAWIINESGGRTPSANATALAGTSKTSGRSSTTNSISKNTEKVNAKQAKTSKNVKYALPEIDSRGKKLTEQQRQFFSDSKVVDSKGNLQVVYHGTNNEFYTFNKELVGKGIDQFGAGYYFTTDKGGAENYGSRVLDVYLNIKKPFTITMADSGGGLDQFYSRSLTKTQAYKILKMHPELYSTDNSPLGDWSERFWTEGATESVIREVAAQMTQIGSFADNSMFGYYPNEFHAAIKEVLGYDGVKVDLRNGESFYVAWEQNQIKDTANARPTTSPDIRYALQLGDEQITVGSEQGKNLVALHNLSEQNLLRVLQLGGFPMPSIAVTKVDLPHENYGNISIVFGRNTIDPEVDSRNVVYDRDAWTPTAPSTDVKLKTEAVDSLISELQGEVGEYSGYRYDVDRFFDGRYKNGAGEYVIEDYNYNKKTVGELATHNAGIMAAYLKEKGADISPIYAERGFTMGWQSFTRSEAQALLQAVGITENITRDNITAEQRAEILEKYINYKAEKNYRLLKRRKPETTFESCYERAKSNYDDGDVSQLLFLSEDFYNKNRPKDVLDDAATEKKLRDSISDMEDFYSWLWNKIENTFEKKGVYNDSDAFDRYGNRRSFEQRHYAYTVGNIVKAMSKGSQEGNAFLGGMTSGALAAKLSVQFDSIESIRAAQDYLKLVSNEEIEAFNSKTYEMYDEIVTEIAGASSDFMSNQTRRDDVGNILGECATVTPLNIENIKRKFAKETKGYDVGYKFNDSIANKVFALFQVLQHIPTTYFEAKPRRAVGLSEIVSVVLPKNSSTELVSKLKSKHIPYEFYDASNGTTRQDVIRKIDSARFALPDTDSTGKKLSTQQREFFSNSKVVDGDGRLLMVYHGTPNGDFYTFEYDKSRQTGTDYGKAFYFTTNLKNAKGYAKDNHRDPRVKEYELKRESLKKQILAETDTTKRQELEKQFRNVKVDGKSILEILYDVDYDTGGEVRQVYLNLVNPLIADAQKKYHYEVYPELFKQAIKNGNDGIIVRNVDDSSKFGVGLSDVYIAFSPEQIKLTTNETPTVNNDIRFALDDSDRDVRGNYTAGQRAKFAANNTAMKVYSRSDAESVISAIMDERLTFDDGKYGVLAGKNRTEVVDYLFKKLNAVKEGYRIGVALKIADYLIDNTTLSDMYAAETVSESMRTLSVLRYYMHKMDLSGIQSEIKHRYDNKNTINLLWAAPKGEKGIAPDTLAQSLESDAIFLSGWNEADMFFEMVDMYESARRDVQESVQQQSLKDYGGKEQLEKLRQDIARDILLAYDNKGTKSKYAKLVEKYTTQIQSLKQQVREANSYNRLVNSVVDKAQRMRDLKLGTFLNSTQYKNDVFKSSIEGLARIKNRGNFNIAGTRKILADLRTWYTTDNPILADTYEQGVADMLDSLSAGNKRFTKEELVTLNNVMAYFTKYVENFNKVYKNGKWVEAIPEATKYIDTIHANSELKVGLFRKLAGTTYMQTFGDPMTVARRMDMYEPNGFYTETLQQLRDAAVDSQIAEMEIMSNYDTFMKKNKKYLAQITKETVSYGGKDVPRSVLIGLYMTLKRQHAQAGLAQNGFAYVDTDGKRVRIDGFAPNIETDAELYFKVVEEQKKIESLLSAADKEYIAILEQAYNNDAKKLKADRDMQRLGFTNATEDYYYPIRRGNIAKNVDTSDIQGEIDRVSNSSFNKDTVKGAKQELFIESADTVFKRHIHAVCQYAFLSPAIETYNRIFNLDVSGNPNKPVSVATESANTWAKGNKYFSKLISDIQGIPTSSGEGNKVLGFIRGNYAKFQLGANPKVWVTQLSSLFASSSILDVDSITKGMFISAKDVDTYCSLAKLRNNDNTAALAQGVLDKLGKVSDVLMAPIGKMDRFVVCRLFGACQVQVAKNGGAKIGTEANKIAAGQLLRRVILETQQNSVATERSAAMRSGNEILRTVTMFTADSMKVVGRVIDSIGELSTLKAKLKVTSNADVRATLQKSIKLANRKVRKSVTSLVTSALFMAAIAQLFSWLYNKDKKDDESTAQTVLIDFLGNLIGGLPVIKDIYARIAQGYDFSNYAYSSINDLLDSSINLVEAAKNLVSGDASQQDIAKGVKNLSYSLGQMFGVPTRNIYNIAYGLTKRVSPVSAYKIDNRFYKKNYVSDLNKALENDDAEMVSYIMSLIYNQRIGDMVNEETRQKLSDLYAKGYSILPRSIGDSIRYDGNEIEMNDAQKRRFMSIYSQANRYIEKLLASSGYGKLSEEKQAKAIKSIYDAFYYQAISDLVGQDANNTLGELSRYITIEKLAVVFSGLSEIASDVDSKGNTISGSRKKKTIKYLLKQSLSDGERLLIMCYRGYSIQDGDYKGYTEQRAKIILLKYILSLKATQAEKAKIAAECGFSVKNGKIDRSSLYSGVGSLSKKNK